MSPEKEVWAVTRANVERWHRQSTDPDFKASHPNYWVNVAFVLTKEWLKRDTPAKAGKPWWRRLHAYLDERA